MSNDNVVPFLFEGENLVRTVTIDDEPWFVAVDVCRVLGIKQATRAVENLDDDEKGVSNTHTLGGNQDLSIVSESGLYALIFRSRKPVAKKFRKWVTSEVLPSIRKTGSFTSEPVSEVLEDVEHRPFPDWPLDEMRSKKGTVDLYRMCYGVMAAQWVMPQLGFPVPPKEMIDNGRQFHLWDATAALEDERDTA